MATLEEEARQLVRSPEFRALSPQLQVSKMQQFMASRAPEFIDLDPRRRAETAAKLIGLHEPGFLERVGDVALTVGQFIPGVSEAIQIGRAATGTPEEMRPISRAIASGLGIEESAFGRAFAEALRIGAETALLFPVGGMLGRRLVGLTRFAPQAIGALAKEAGPQAAARVAKLEPVISHAATFGTTGALFGVLDAMENQEIRPLEQFVVNPLMMAALGAGVGRVFGRPLRPTHPLEGQAIDQILATPVMQEAVDQGRIVVEALRRHGKIDVDEGIKILTKGLREPLDTREFRLFHEALQREPELLKTDMGLAVLNAQRPHLEARTTIVEDAPLRVTVERNGQVETLLPKTRAEAFQLVKQHENRELLIREVTGPAKDVHPFTGITRLPPTAGEAIPVEAPRQPPAPLPPGQLPTRAEIAGVPEAATRQLPRVIEGVPSMPGPVPTALEAGMERFGLELPSGVKPAISLTEQAVREQLDNPLIRDLSAILEQEPVPLPRQPLALQAGLPEARPLALGTRLEAVGPEPRGFPELTGQESTPTFMMRGGRGPMPGPGAKVKIVETGEVGTVSRIEGPIVVVETGAGPKAAIPLADGTVRTTAPTRPLKPGRPHRPVTALTDDELWQGAALLAHRAQTLHGAAQNRVVERHGEFLAELHRRFGKTFSPDQDGFLASHLKECL